MLETGTKAPAFALADQNGEIRTLESFRGKKLILYFYSKDNTSGCTNQAKGYTALAAEFAALGVQIAGVSRDSVSSHKRFEEKQGLGITLLSDPEREAIEAYDVWKEKKLYGKVSMGVVRTTYVIDGDGTIVYANGRVKAAEDAAKMLEVVKGL